MTQSKHRVSGGAAIKVSSIPGALSEDFSSFPAGTRFEPGTQYPSPSGMYIRVNAGAGLEYPPDAQIITVAQQHAIAIQLGAAAPLEDYPVFPQPRGNSIVFDLPMGLTRQITTIGVTLNARFAGAIVNVVGLYFDPDSALPAIPGYLNIGFLSERGDMPYSIGPVEGRQTFVSVYISIETQAPNFPSELPMEIKNVSWVYKEADG